MKELESRVDRAYDVDPFDRYVVKVAAAPVDVLVPMPHSMEPNATYPLVEVNPSKYSPPMDALFGVARPALLCLFAVILEL